MSIHHMDRSTPLAHTTRPKLAPGLETRPFADGLVVTLDGAVHLSLENADAEILHRLDGTATAEALEHEFGAMAMDLVEELDTAGMLVGSDPYSEQRILVSGLGFEFAGFDHLVDRMYGWGGAFLLAPGFVAVLGALIVGGVFTTLSGWQTSSVDRTGLGVSALLVVIVVRHVAVFLHETAHALVVRHGGRRVGRAGVGFYWGAVTFFVDTTDSLFLSKRHRLAQTLAGPAVDAVLASSLAIASHLPVGSSTSSLLSQLAVLMWIDVLVNLAPVLELDGYWLVADLLDRPNLYGQATAALRRVVAGTHGDGDLRLASYGLISVLGGLTILAWSVQLILTTYPDLLASAWSQGAVGKVISVLFIAPLLATGATAVSALLRRLIARMVSNTERR